VLAKRLWNWEPHPGQREFLTLRLPDGTRPKLSVAACGRRWGKTEGVSVDVALDLLLEPDLAQLLVGPTRDQADGLFDAVVEKLDEIRADESLLAEFPRVADFEVKRSPYCHIRRKSDRQVVLSARSAGRNGRNLRGKGTTRKMKRFKVRVDEAAFVPDQAINEAIRPMLATVPGGGELTMISSPNGKRGVFYESFLKGERQEGKARSVRLPSSQNPLVDPEFLAEMREEMTDRQFQSEFLAEFVDAAGQVFLDADIDAATCDDDYGSSPLWGCTYVIGVDFGRRADWTVISVGEASADGVRLVQQTRVQGLGWASQVERIAETVRHWGARRLVCDATGVGDAVAEDLILELTARRLPCEIEPFTFTGVSKPLLMDGLGVALAARRCSFPAIPVLISELRNFEAIPSTSGGREKMAAARGHDDTVCALALMVRAASPWLAQAANAKHGGGFVIASGGARKLPLGDFASRKDRELQWSARYSKGSRTHFGAHALIIRSRLLRSVYRSAFGRVVGGSAETCFRSLHRIMSR
ncbi:MAG: hypothetical protein H8F28_10045, partial [Fibrella sp.]|nr:hypothetical protein [Armatimonadota bacterium]